MNFRKSKLPSDVLKKFTMFCTLFYEFKGVIIWSYTCRPNLHINPKWSPIAEFRQGDWLKSPWMVFLLVKPIRSNDELSKVAVLVKDSWLSDLLLSCGWRKSILTPQGMHSPKNYFTRISLRDTQRIAAIESVLKENFEFFVDFATKQVFVMSSNWFATHRTHKRHW